MPVKSNIEFIVIHCAATRPEWWASRPVEAKRDEIARWHVDGNGWRAIGYAGIIDRDGSYAKGRDLDQDGDTWEEIGAHVAGQNSRSVGLCLMGGYGGGTDDDFFDNFTQAQYDTMMEKVQEIRDYCGWEVPVRGHNEFANKACPTFNVQRLFAEHKRKLAEAEPEPRTTPIQSTTIQAAAAGAVTATGAAGTAVAQLTGTAQTIAIVGAFLIIAMFLYIIRERLQKWAKGDR